MTEKSEADESSRTENTERTHTDREDSVPRREFTAALGAGVIAAVAGCVGGGDDSGDGPSDGTDGDDGSTEDGSDTAADGDDGESEESTTDGDDGSDDDSGDGDDGEDGESTTDGESDGSDDGNDGNDGDDGSDDSSSDDSSGDDSSDALGAEFMYEASFIVEGTVQSEEVGGELQFTSRHHDGNYHQTMEDVPGTGEMEIYLVDGTMYQVVGGQCFEGQQGGQAPDVDSDVNEDDEILNDLPPEPDRTDTIDGESMDVYEFEAGEANLQDPLTVYLSSETGYLRRIETGEFTFDYHSWGEVDPIEAPDMECQEIDSGGMDF